MASRMRYKELWLRFKQHLEREYFATTEESFTEKGEIERIHARNLLADMKVMEESERERVRRSYL